MANKRKHRRADRAAIQWTRALFVSWALVGLAGGCDRSKPNPAPVPKPVAAAAPAVPAAFYLAAAPADAADVAAARAAGKDGSQVVIRGVIGGSEQPIDLQRATFTLLDPAAQTCNKMAGHGCPTPWDACCEDPDKLKSQTIAVRVVDAQGKPIEGSFQSVPSLAPLKQVTVVGTLHLDPPTIDAAGIYAGG